MLCRIFSSSFLALCAAWAMGCGTPAAAADGQVVITQSKALAGNVTSGDAAGFPITLSKSGSYILASNISPGPNLDGIIAASPDISINLNGFTLSGGPAGLTNNAMRGIVDLGDRLTVKNGTIGAFKDIALDATNRPYLIVEDVRVINSGYGIYAYNGVFTRILNSTVATNVHIGIYCGLSCQIEGTVVSGNGGAGIGIRTGTIFANTIINNGGYGINSSITTGFGNNTLIDNNGGGAQTSGQLLRLYPNACSPVAC